MRTNNIVINQNSIADDVAVATRSKELSIKEFSAVVSFERLLSAGRQSSKLEKTKMSRIFPGLEIITSEEA